jgi:ubiquinone/menaquinone biosynthesis C-methylase UbiE
MNRGELVFGLLENCEKILDVGCANGYYTKLYSKKCNKIYGVDPNLSLIEKAKEENPKIDFVRSGAENLPFEREIFDIVILSDVLEHVENEKKSLDEAFRVLKKKGKVIITVPHKGLFDFLDVDNYSWKIRQFPGLYKFIHRLKNREPPRVREGYLNKHRHYSLEGLKKLLDKFVIVEYKRTGLVTGSLGNNLSLFFRWTFNKNIKFDRLKDLDSRFSFGKYSSALAVIAIKSE